MSIKTSEEISIMREGGRRHVEILLKLAELSKPGTAVADLDQKGRQLIEDFGGLPSFLNYTPEGAPRPYPSAVCVSVNHEIVHGVSSESVYILKEGDVVSIDLGFTYKNLITDAAVTVGVGKIDEKKKKLLSATQQALKNAVKSVKHSSSVGDIGSAVMEVAKKNSLEVVKNLAGHGVGYSVHEDPFIPNTGKKGSGEKLLEGMVLAIEPMLTFGNGEISLEADGFTYSTFDDTLSAHFEQTVVVTKKGVEVLTPFSITF